MKGPEIPPATLAENDQLRAAADAELDRVLTVAQNIIDQFGEVSGAALLAWQLEAWGRDSTIGMLTVALLRLLKQSRGEGGTP